MAANARQIRVTGGTNTDYFTKVVSSATTITDFLSSNDIATQGASIQLDGRPLSAADMSKTFGDLVTGDDCRLFSVVNAKNA